MWICPWPNGHIQATGFDAAGRRQYRYHDQWRARRDAEKHERVLEIAHQLPDVRDEVVAALRTRGLNRERVLAAAIRLLDLAAFRVGSEQYAEENGTYGLATLRREHVRVRGERTYFSYTAKGGIEREVELTDRPTATVVRQLLERPEGTGEELLAYQVEDGTWRDVTSSEINAYLKEISGAEITAKDFRTWNATVLMAVKLAEAPRADVADRAEEDRERRLQAGQRAAGQHPGGVQGELRRPAGGRPVRATARPSPQALGKAEDAEADRDVQRVLEQAVCQMLSA